MLESKTFSTAARMARFLQFVVEAAVDGRADHLKESGIAIAVFDRTPDFNPREDPIVRSEARRLRQRIEQYYQTEGLEDSIRVEMPKGGYLPLFSVLAPVIPSVAPEPGILPGKSDKRPRRLVAGVSVLLALSFAVFVLLRPKPNELAWLNNPVIVPFTSLAGEEFDATFSPDGRFVAFVWDGNDGNFNIYKSSLPGGPPSRLTSSPAKDLHPSWSPAGNLIAFLRASRDSLGLFVIHADGSEEQRVAGIQLREWFNWNSDPLLIAGNPGPAWAGDGKSLFATDSTGVSTGAPIWRISLETQSRTQTTHPDGLSHDFYPAVSRNGRYLAFVRQFSAAACDLYLADLWNGTERRLTSEKRDVRGVTWGPGDRSLVFSSNRAGGYRLWSLAINEGAIAPVPSVGNRVTNPAMSRDGLSLVYTNATVNANIWSAPLARPFDTSAAARIVASSSGFNQSPTVSPDGKTLAWSSDRSGFWEIWISSTDGKGPRELTKLGHQLGGGLLGTPRWSPDSSRMAFDARPNGHAAVMIVDVQSGTARLLDQNPFEERMPSWSNDGRWLYFNSDRDGEVHIWKRPASGGEAIRVTSRRSYQAIESLDGRTVYFLPALDEPGIYSVPSGGGAERLLPGTETFFIRRHWDVARDGIYFAGHESQPLDILFYPFSGGRIERVRRLTHPLIVDTPSLAISPDARMLLFSQQDEEKSDIMMLHK